MPLVIVNDLDYNPHTNILNAGTFGKSLMSYSLDGLVTPPTATADPLDEQIQLSPNPASNLISLSSKNQLLDKARLSIYNNEGRLLSKPLLNGNQSIDVSAYEPGIYFLNILTEDGPLIKRFVKM